MLVRLINPSLFCLFLSALFVLQPFVFADGNISTTNKYAWAENAGWHNFRPSYGGVTVCGRGSDSFLSGYAWAENVGWVKLAAGTNGPFNNDSTNDWGVNMDADWNLSGYAWNEITGWINFDSTHTNVTIDSATGSFDGYAWGENVGWVHFHCTNDASSNAYQVQTVALCAPTNFSATDGSYTNKVLLTWGAVSRATSYEVWRNTSSNSGTASRLSVPSSTDYNDSSAIPGVDYYYWMKSASASWTGEFSVCDSGWRGLPTPSGVSASDGTYSSKVRITWAASEGAASYEVWRNLINDSSSAAWIVGVTSTNYDDTPTPGTVYYYWLKTKGTNNHVSVFSSPDSGYRFLSTPVSASDGTDTDKVVVNWISATGAVNYQVWRCITFDEDYASILAEVSVTNFNDTSASPGVRYYYWVHPVDIDGGVGSMSSNDTGYRALSAPAGIFASDGTYTNKVRITWAASDGATSYEVYRAIEGDSITNVFHASGTSYDDTQVTGGVTYSYRVKAMNNRYTSALSRSDTGYILSHPSGITASDGAYVGQVRVQWSSIDSATGYEVWRADRGVIGFAAKISDTTGTNYTDTSVTAGTVYYYWVRPKNATATGGFSEGDSGYAGSDSADLFVWDLVVLPNTIGTTSHPSVVSFRMGNKGTDALASPNTAVRMDFYASTNTTFGDEDELLIGYTAQDITLSAGTNTIVKVSDVSALTLPAAAGDYYIFVSVNHMYPSALVDTNLADNTAMRAGAINVSESGSLFYRAINDYDGDGVSDLALYYGGYWYIRSVDGRVIAYGAPWGTPEMVPVYGDYDGDKIADLAVYGNGLWYARTVAGSVILWGASLGGTGFSPVYGDFTGTGSADMAVYVDSTGAWYILEPGVGVVLWGNEWGGAGLVPVPGDYDGDGTWDMAVYNEETGAWYVRTVSGVLLLWGESWGGLGYEPVSGDFDGDGLWDMTVYHEETGYWFIRTVAGGTLLLAQKFGETGYVPVYGDYNGDGVSDMAVYHEAIGKWYIRSVDGTILLWDSLWGSPGYVPVGR